MIVIDFFLIRRKYLWHSHSTTVINTGFIDLTLLILKRLSEFFFEHTHLNCASAVVMRYLDVVGCNHEQLIAVSQKYDSYTIIYSYL